MRIYWAQIIFVIIYFCLKSVVCDVFTATLIGLGSVAYDKIYKYTYCKLKECCTENEIPADFDKLQQLLHDKVYGQHLVQDNLVDILRSHWSGVPTKKALTISFHGWPGSGKNYVARFIQESLYTKGTRSDHVHHFMGRILFPLEENTQEYKSNLYEWIKSNVTKCEKQLFIFDEVDKMPPGILDVIKPLIDYNDNVDGVDYRQSVFIFLSNTGGLEITHHLLNMWEEGKTRESIKLYDFDKLIIEGAFNEKGGFFHSDTIKSNLIDHYIPFLPLERKHVKLCIKDEFTVRNISSPEEVYIKEIEQFITMGPDSNPMFSKTGCKRISQQVALFTQKLRRDVK